MKCLLIFYVRFEDKNGDQEDFGIEKEFEFLIRPMIGDKLTVCGDSEFSITSVSYDVDRAEVEVRCDRGPELDSVQRWIDNGFRLHDMGVEPPPHLSWHK